MTPNRSKTKYKNIVHSLTTRTTGSFSPDSHLIMRQYAEDYCAHSTSHKVTSIGTYTHSLNVKFDHSITAYM